jgi:1-deoxy-D-xylulose-5-phosphate synthase
MLIDNGVTDINIKRIGIKDTFVEHGPQDVLKRDYEIDSQAIINTALKLHGISIE